MYALSSRVTVRCESDSLDLEYLNNNERDLMTPSPVNNLPASAATESICARWWNPCVRPRTILKRTWPLLFGLENVGILLGAGASAGALGGVTMADLWTDFTKCYQASAAWLRYEGFISAGENVNVEKVTDALEITRLEWERVNRPRKLQELRKARADVLRSVVRASLLQQPWWGTAIYGRYRM